MLKLIGSVMIFGSCAALGLNARRELRRRVAAADAMLLALRLIKGFYVYFEKEIKSIYPFSPIFTTAL